MRNVVSQGAQRNQTTDEYWNALANGSLEQMFQANKFSESFIQKQQRMLELVEKQQEQKKGKYVSLSQEQKQEKARQMATAEQTKEKREISELLQGLMRKVCELVARLEQLERAAKPVSDQPVNREQKHENEEEKRKEERLREIERKVKEIKSHRESQCDTIFRQRYQRVIEQEFGGVKEFGEQDFIVRSRADRNLSK